MLDSSLTLFVIHNMLCSSAACEVLRDVFWWVWCSEFQPECVARRAQLRGVVSSRYMEIMGALDGAPADQPKKALRANAVAASRRSKDLFFQYFPYAIANAVCWGFYLLLPTMRIANAFDEAFKWRVYSDVHMMLTGIDAAPSTLRILREQLFPDEDARKDGEKGAHINVLHTVLCLILLTLIC